MWPLRELMSLFLICKPGWARTEHSRVWAAAEMVPLPALLCGTRSGQAGGGQPQSRTQQPGRVWREAGRRQFGGSDPVSQQPC